MYAGQSEPGLSSEDPSAVWNSQQPPVGSFQEVASAAPFQPPPPPQPQPPSQVPGVSVQHQHMQVQPIPAVVPTSGEPMPPHLSSHPVDWQQFQVQMQVLSQQNPAFFQQMQQFFWSQSLTSQHQLQQLQAQQYQHIQPPQAAATVEYVNRQLPTGGEYNLVNFPPTQVMDMAEQKGGPPAAHYMTAPTGGLFIPPMAHIPSHVGEAGTNQSQTPRQRNAIPIIPPKV